MSELNARTIVMCAFGAHSYKEISRSQLASAAKYFSKGEEKKMMAKAEKQQLIVPLASIFIRENIVTIREGADLTNLSMDDVCKEGTF